jgi:hypothetical protein
MAAWQYDTPTGRILVVGKAGRWHAYTASHERLTDQPARTRADALHHAKAILAGEAQP